MSDLQHLANQLNISIVYSSVIDGNGHYLPMIDTIVINETLSETEMSHVLAHELGHACLHKNELALYNTTFSNHSKMEFQADCFKVEHLLDEYLKTSDISPHAINYCHFMESNDIDFSLEGYIRDLVTQRTTLLSCG